MLYGECINHKYLYLEHALCKNIERQGTLESLVKKKINCDSLESVLVIMFQAYS